MTDLTIGVDIGGTKIAAGVVDAEGTIVARTRKETPAHDPAGIKATVAEAVAELRREHDVAAVGVAAAGFVDATRSTVLFAPNVAWRDEPLRRDLEELMGVDVVVENDANAAGWGEFAFGGGREADDMVLLTIGTGLGGAIVLNGRLLRGAYGVAAELGHVRMVPGGLLCGCGNRGCWEQYASGSALVREARELVRSGSPLAASLLARADGNPESLNGPMVTTAAQEGDQLARELLVDLGSAIGDGIADLAAILDPAVVVIGGGVSEAGELLLEPARAAFRRHLTGRGYRPVLDIVPAALGNDAGLIGAADLARRG
jgi:glucokinase